MKKSISTFLIFAFLTAAYGQETNITIPEITKASYLKKSKSQKTTAWVLLGTGALSFLVGSIEVNPDYGESTNRPFMVVGGLIAIGASIPLFSSSARNRRRAHSLSLGNQFVPQMICANWMQRAVPSLHLKLNL
jgi:hypothetical protein